MYRVIAHENNCTTHFVITMVELWHGEPAEKFGPIAVATHTMKSSGTGRYVAKGE